MAAEDPVVIVGGGLAGLTALYENLKNGVPTVLYERNPNQLGGVIRSKDTGNKVLDLGAELIDSTHTSLIALCKEMDIQLIDTLADEPGGPANDASGTGEEQAYYLNSKTGRVCSDDDLLKPNADAAKATGTFIPLAEEIRKDYAAIGRTPDGVDWLDTPFNQKLDKMTAQEYLAGKCEILAKEGRPADAGMLAAIENAYQCENGRDLTQISALLFINQLGQGQTGKGIDFSEGFSIFGGSDERWKVPGGTAHVIEKLKEKCEAIAHAQGFPPPLKMGRTLESVERGPEGKTILHFQTPGRFDDPVTTDYVISALPAPALGRVKGVENLGLSADQADLLAGLQYTNSSKVFFEVNGEPWKNFTITGSDGKKKRVTDSNGNFYGGTIKECWPAGADALTKDGTTWVACFIGGSENDKYQSPKDLIEAARREYARILGKDMGKIFTKNGKPLGKAILWHKAAGGGIGCYASPGIAQGIPLMKMSQNLRDGTTVDGRPVAGFVGTWIPSIDKSNETPCLNVGFMDVGVENAMDASQKCVTYITALRQAAKNAEVPVTVAPVGSAYPGGLHPLTGTFNNPPSRAAAKPDDKLRPAAVPLKADA